jgi:hypothetical protein
MHQCAACSNEKVYNSLNPYKIAPTHPGEDFLLNYADNSDGHKAAGLNGSSGEVSAAPLLVVDNSGVDENEL